MLVLAAVPDVQFHKLRRAAGSRFNVAQVSTWDDVLTSIRGRPVELAVVDPLLSGQGRSQEIERLRVLFPSLPLMLYTTLTPRTAGVLLALGQRGIQHAVFANYDDHPSRLREVLGQEEARSSSRQLLDQLGDALAPLPSELRWVLEEALRSPGEVQTVGQVAVRARVDRRTCERWFTRVGLPSPRHFLSAARSEEHTSELQSRVDLVCRLLLEKKKIRLQLLPGPPSKGLPRADVPRGWLPR